MGVASGAAPVVVILGPTATGKSELAVETALRFNGEIVSADSRQVYRYMDIGTAKPTPEQRALVPHHLIDVVDPHEDCNVATYQREVREAIEGILARGRLPFLVGGSGLYLAAAMGELDLPIVGPDAEFRARTEQEAGQIGPESLHQRLAQVDPATAARLHPHDVRRVIRALEVHHLTGLPLSAFSRKKSTPRHCEGSEAMSKQDCFVVRPGPPNEKAGQSSCWTGLGGLLAMTLPLRFLRIGLTAPREVLYRRIGQRIDEMMELGLVAEVEALLARGYHLGLKSMDSLGYREMGAHLEARMSWEQAVEAFKRNTRRFAKRQLTWFRKTPQVRWFDITEPSFLSAVAGEIGKAEEALRWVNGTGK